MTIKQLGGVFGRNPTFNDVTIEGTLTFDGALDINSDINLPDNKKITFGDGEDLQIYHDGSNSVIKESGTGELQIRGTDLKLQDADGNNYISMIDGGTGGTVYLKHNGVDKLATTSTGIDVTGTVIVNSGGTGNGLVKINGATGNTEAIIFQRGGTEASRIGHSNSADLTFSTGSGTTERMRLDSSGNLLVGKTSASSATVGFQAGQDGFIAATRTSSEPLVLNRLTSDGLIASFRKDGAQVGSIGATSGRLYIGDGDVALRFSDDLDFISPWDASTNAARDGAIDLGNAGNRFKDIYLSGGVYVGGTGAANKLDDYEEGTFTATLRGGTSEPGTLITTTGRYTKIGNTVHIRIGYENVDTTGYSGGMSVEGCPFTNSSSARAQLSVGHYQTTTWSTTEIPIAQLGISATTIILQNTVSGNVWTSNIHNAGTSRFMWITGAYEAA